MKSSLEDIMDIMKKENIYFPMMGTLREKSSDDDLVIGEDKLAKKIWNQSADFKQFKEEMLKHEYYDFETWEERNIFGHLSQKTENHRDRLLNFFGDRCFDVKSSEGRLIIRNDGKQDWIRCEAPLRCNEIKVALFEKDELDHEYFFDMFGKRLSFRGKTDIYDCDNKIVKTVEGFYEAWKYKDIVAFVEL